MRLTNTREVHKLFKGSVTKIIHDEIEKDKVWIAGSDGIISCYQLAPFQ